MKRFFARLGRFFWSWRFLKFILWMVTLTILLEVEENWRGARAWAEIRAGWEAKGETFDIQRLAPPPVPNDQNLAALPLFNLEPDPENHGIPTPLALRRAFKYEQEEDLPRDGNWEAGLLADTEKNRRIVAADYAMAFKGAPAPPGALDQFEARFPALIDLRAAAVARPYCRFDQKYDFELPNDLFIPLISDQMMLSKFLTADAVLALDAGKTDVALKDIQTNFKLMDGLQQQPFIVSGLVSIGMTAIDFSAVYQGLALHEWSDAQLADLENELGRIDFLTDYQHCLRGEAAIMTTMDDQYKHNRRELVAARNAHGETIPPAPPKRRDVLPFFWPDGWIDLIKSNVATFDLTAIGFVDPAARLVFPKSEEEVLAEVEQRQRGWGGYTIWGILSGEAVGPISNAAMKFAQMQVWVDEARIACALERHRLANRAFPDALDSLAPMEIDSVPHDIMNGKPYHYQLQPDGTFLLYSVGWNQVDDGGKMVFEKDAPAHHDYAEGDWVWPTPRTKK
jgi:hypothetical protein